MQVDDELRERAMERSKGRMAAVRTENSRYLLSGGLLVCKRCGANMVGYRNQGRLYYVCGSRAYRKGLGCGKALQVRKEEIEDAVVEEVSRLFRSGSDARALVQTINQELRALREQQAAEGVEISRELAHVEREIANIRRAVRSGLDDVEWANQEPARLKSE